MIKQLVMVLASLLVLGFVRPLACESGPFPDAPQFVSIAVNPVGLVTLALSTGNGIPTLLQASQDLASWQPLGVVYATNGLALFVDAPVAAPAARFYRAISLSTTNAVFAVSTMEELRDFVPSSPVLVELEGYYVPGDGGGGGFYWNGTSTEPDDGGSVIAPAANPTAGRWIRIFNGATQTAWFGAVGDGVSDDTGPLEAAIAAAGVGGTVTFNGGSTYLVSTELRCLLTGQTWSGYGARLVRSPVRFTTTTNAIGAGTNGVAFVVADPSQLKVGDVVTVLNGSSFDPNRHLVLNITSNMVTLATPFGVSFPVGGTVLTCHCTIVGGFGLTNFTVRGFEIDGNQQGNTLLQRWELNAEINVVVDNARIQDCFVHDSQSEGIVFGGVGSVVQNCSVVNCQGNGVHMTAWESVSILNNTITNCNLAGQATGHPGGCIAFSVGSGDVLIQGNFLYNGLSGVGDMEDISSRRTTIEGNIIRDCAQVGAFSMEHPDTVVDLGQLVVSGNLVYDSGISYFENTDDSAPPFVGPQNILITDNYFENSVLKFDQASNIQVENNQFNLGTNNLVGITLQDTAQSVISGNNVSGGESAIYVFGAKASNVTISGNDCQSQMDTGIYLDPGPTNVFIQDNTIGAFAPTPNASYLGIVCGSGSTVDGNVLNLGYGRTGLYCGATPAGFSGAVIFNNVIMSPSGTSAIEMSAGSIGNTITGNLVEQGIVNGGGAGNTITNNTTIP